MQDLNFPPPKEQFFISPVKQGTTGNKTEITRKQTSANLATLISPAILPLRYRPIKAGKPATKHALYGIAPHPCMECQCSRHNYIHHSEALTYCIF